MTFSNKDIEKKLRSKDIDDVVDGLDNWMEEVSFLMEQSMFSLKENVDWRPFIAERIYKVIQKQKATILSFYNQAGDDSLHFWLSILMLEFERNAHYFSHLLNYVKTHEDGQEILGLNILIQEGATEVGEIIIDKLKKLEFNISTFDKTSFYLDGLKRLGISLPSIIIERAKEYNTRVEHEWQKLIY